MKKGSILLLTAMLLLTGIPGKAEETALDSLSRMTPEEFLHKQRLATTKFICIDGGKNEERPTMSSSMELMETFYQDQFRHFNDPEAPMLMFMSKDADFAMGLGGAIRLRAWYGWDGNIDFNGFCPYLINMDPSPASHQKLSASAGSTALTFTMFGKNKRFGRYLGIIEANFNGANKIGLQLKKAYVTMGDLTVGYAISTFCDPSTIPPTVDGAGPNGQSFRTNVLARYFHSFHNHWSVAGGVEIPNSQINITDAVMAEACDDWLPDIVALGQYEWGISHVRLSALAGMMTYRSLTDFRRHNVVAWATQLSAKVNVSSPWNLYGQVNLGKGFASYLNDLSLDNFDLIGKYGVPGEMFAPTTFGVTVGTQYYILPNLFATLVFGENALYTGDDRRDDTYRRGFYAAANIFWYPAPRFSIGGEYLWGERTDYDRCHKDASRADILFQFFF